MPRFPRVTSACIASLILVVPFAMAEAVSVDLGDAEPFAILAGAGITNTGTTTVRGDVGSHPTASQTGFGPGANQVIITGGTNHHDDAVTQDAKDALVTAYDAAAAQPPDALIDGELGGLTLVSGVYRDDGSPASLAITGTLTLDGQNDTNSTFVFQSASTLVTASGSNVVLINGAQACNVFWQVGSSATLGTDSHLEGTILALTSITLDHGATLDGRALARNGAVTMDNNTILRSACAPFTPPPTTTPTPTTPTPTTPTPTTPTPTTPTPTSPTPTTPTPTTPTPTGPTIPIPVFPSTTAVLLAAVGAVGIAAAVLLRRRP